MPPENENMRTNESRAVAGEANWPVLFAAWAVSLTATLGALFIGEVMGQVPCTFCWHQRAFMFPLAVILAVACHQSDTSIWRYALPLSLIGWLIAGWHTLLFYGVVSEALQPCTASGPSCSGSAMMLGWAPLPVLSLLAFTAILLLMTILARGGRKA